MTYPTGSVAGRCPVARRSSPPGRPALGGTRLAHAGCCRITELHGWTELRAFCSRCPWADAEIAAGRAQLPAPTSLVLWRMFHVEHCGAGSSTRCLKGRIAPYSPPCPERRSAACWCRTRSTWRVRVAAAHCGHGRNASGLGRAVERRSREDTPALARTSGRLLLEQPVLLPIR
jgi:hypothetical protein